MEKAQSSDLNRGHNVIRDGLMHGDGVSCSLLQNMIGGRVTEGILGKLGLTDCSMARKVAETLVGTGVDTSLDGIVSSLTGQKFDFWDSLARNAFANALAAFISDPVDAVTGTYTINTTDFILASLPSALRLERTYSSTSGKSSCMGRGWSFNYGSRIYRDTGDTEHTRIHLEAVTGHSLCFEKQDGGWVNQGRGTARFRLEAREGAAEGETFLLTDVMGSIHCAPMTGRGSCAAWSTRTGRSSGSHTTKTGLKGSRHLLGTYWK